MDGSAVQETAADRILARQRRLEAKKAGLPGKKDKGGGDGTGFGFLSEGDTPHNAIARIAEGITALETKKAKTEENVTAVRIQADKREKGRRSAEEERVQERLHRLREEAAASGRANAAVQLKWSDILERNLPQELAVELATQKQACAAILQSKEALLAFLAREMKSKDEQYVQALQAQKEDVDALIQRMSTQFSELSAAFEAELSAMEGAFMDERADLMAANKKEVDALFEMRRNMEARFVEEKISREEAYARELSDMQAADAENYQKLKVKLETDVAVLEQQLEAMKFTYLLNTEKLEYNYRVLTERDSENKLTLAAQKQRLARLRAALSKVQGEYESTDSRFKSRNTALTDEYTRITKQYRELQAKFRHFEASDALRFAEVGAMHEEEMKAMASRLVSADKAITEQLLGWAWVPPPAPGTATTANNNNATMGNTAGAGGAGGDPYQQHQHDGMGMGMGAGDVGSATGSVASSAAAAAAAASSHVQVHPLCLRALLRLLVKECSAFLIDSKTAATAAALQASGQHDVAEAIQADCTLRSLECTKQEDVNGLCVALQTAIISAAPPAPGDEEADEHTAAAMAVDRLRGPPSEFTGGSGLDEGDEDQEEEDQEDDSGNKHRYGIDVVDPSNGGCPRLPPGFQLVGFLKEWLGNKKGGNNNAASPGAERRASFSGPSSPHSGAGGANAGAGGDPLSHTQQTGATGGGQQGQVASVLEDQAHWNALADTIPQQKVRIWQALEKALIRYKGVLLSRSQIMDECTALEEENVRLQQAVRGYLDPGYHGLQVPPVHTLPPSAFAVASSSSASASASSSSSSGAAASGTSARPLSTNRGLYRPGLAGGHSGSSMGMGGGHGGPGGEPVSGSSLSGNTMNGGLLTIIPATPSPSRGGPRAASSASGMMGHHHR